MRRATYVIPRDMLRRRRRKPGQEPDLAVVSHTVTVGEGALRDPAGVFWTLLPGSRLPREPATWRCPELAEQCERVARDILAATGRPGFYALEGGRWVAVEDRARCAQLQQLCHSAAPHPQGQLRCAAPAGVLRVGGAAVCEVRAVTDPHHPARREQPASSLAFGVWARANLDRGDYVLLYSHGAHMGFGAQMDARMTPQQRERAAYLADCGELPGGRPGAAGVRDVCTWGNPLAGAACMINDPRCGARCRPLCAECGAYAGRRANVEFRVVLEVGADGAGGSALHHLVATTRALKEGSELLMSYGEGYWDCVAAPPAPAPAARPLAAVHRPRRRAAASPREPAADPRAASVDFRELEEAVRAVKEWARARARASGRGDFDELLVDLVLHDNEISDLGLWHDEDRHAARVTLWLPMWFWGRRWSSEDIMGHMRPLRALARVTTFCISGSDWTADTESSDSE